MATTKDWKNELNHMLDFIEKESFESLNKIHQQFDDLGLPFNDAFRKNVLKMVTLRLESTFTTTTLKQWDKRHSRVQIYVKGTMGETYTFMIKLSNTIEVLKEGIAKLTGMPPDQQRLIFAGKQLDNAHSLASYNIKEESTLHLVLRLCGC